MIPSRYRREKPAIIMGSTGKTISYGELEDLSNQFAHLFRQHGLKRGDGIAICLENHAMFLPICWSAFRSGLYYTAISYRLQPEEVEYIVNDCGAKVFITSKMLTDTYLGLKDNLVNEPACYMIDDVADGAASLEEAIAGLPTIPIEDESYGERLLYSSGTTGRPKGVKRALSTEGFGQNDEAVRALNRYEYDEDTVYLSPAPLYHAAPLGFTMSILRFGGALVIMERFEEEQALALIEKYRVTHSQWVPTMFVRMLKLPEEVRSKYDLGSLRIAIHAAAPCPIEVKEQMIDWWGPVLYEYYAGTEAIGSTAITSEEWLLKKGSVGTARRCTLHILDEDDTELPTGEIGGVYFEPDVPVEFEYLNDPEKTRSSFSKQGWFTLGDVGYLDEDGYLFLTDRKSFMIISGGVNIYPQETEDALITHPKVFDVAVFGVPNPEFGEEVKAVVQPVDMSLVGPELEAELIAFARTKISHIKCPRTIDFMEELPRHPTGKLYKRLLKDKYWNKETA